MHDDPPTPVPPEETSAPHTARFPADLHLPPGDTSLLKEASAAVAQEFGSLAQWKQLHCQKVSVVAEHDRGNVHVIHVGKRVDFDWSWEGAKAFASHSATQEINTATGSLETLPNTDDPAWSGEIMEVDEINGSLFLTLDDPEAIPQTGPFYVRPYEFLSGLHAIYRSSAYEAIREKLPERLRATEGNRHPHIPQPTRLGLPHLADWWQHSWNILWGPPGTGKTWTAGQQIARILSDESERVLVISTTNRASDAAALSIGEAAKEHCPAALENQTLLRIGKGAFYPDFVEHELDAMLAGTESEVLSKISELVHDLPQLNSPEDKAFTRQQISTLNQNSSDQSRNHFLNPEKQVIISTAFKAMSFLEHHEIRSMIEAGDAPFTTIVIDEAGLISRATIAALSLLAAQRVVLVGDSKQLAPISRISRVLPTRQQTWLASSGLSHLEETSVVPTGVHLLSEQRRMHPDVCRVVSEYQYNGILKTANARIQQSSPLPAFLSQASRTIWYVMDDEASDLATIRASRGPGEKSWVRKLTPTVMEKLFSNLEMQQSRGLFIAPFKAQAQVINSWFARNGLSQWQASTVHTQQGLEADIVIFDSVNAGSQAWGIVEWKRLVNVAVSRAREAVIVLASRSEMEEPYLRPLRRHLDPYTLVREGAKFVWHQADPATPRTYAALKRTQESFACKEKADDGSTTDPASSSFRMGDQFAAREGMQPVLSEEQQRLANLELDGKPRLVRGVAGSGKSVVLCNWLAKTVRRMRGKTDAKIWAVYANRSLHKLLCDSILTAWESQIEGDLLERPDFPWEMVELLHIKDVLALLLPNDQLNRAPIGFDYDRAAEEFLNRHDAADLLPRCSALFIDEAQDMGPSTLRLLLSVVEQTDASNANSRSAHIFYDNAQNVYEKKTPKWSDFGLNMRGRSTIMRESFRSTRAITELAVNVLDRLSGSDAREDQREMIALKLLKETKRNGERWLDVRYSQVEGPNPLFRQYGNRDEEMAAITKHVKHLIEQERISPTDITIIFNGVHEVLESKLAPRLAQHGLELSVQRSQSFERQPNTLIATTAHSYKGYESEVVIIPCVEQFIASENKVLATGLYVAMTRARSLLAIYGLREGSEAGRLITNTIASSAQAQQTPPIVEIESDAETASLDD